MKQYVKYRGQWRRADNPIPAPKPKQVTQLVAARVHHEPVINLHNQGLTYREIAQRLGVSMRTVARYIAATYSPQQFITLPSTWEIWNKGGRV